MRQRNRTHCNCGQALVGEHAQFYKKRGKLCLHSCCRDCRRSRERHHYYQVAAARTAFARPVTVYPQYRRWLEEIAAQVIR